MVNRKIILVNKEFYHIYNKAVGNEIIFSNKHHLNRVLALTNFYRFKSQLSFSRFQDFSLDKQKEIFSVISSSPPLVEIYCFSFMPNHHHFLVKQLQDNGIEEFISNIQNGFSKYYNKKYGRKGALFCHSFERVRIETEEQFIHVSRYIHLNPVTAYIIKLEGLDDCPYTSFPQYLGRNFFDFINIDYLLNHFKTPSRYKKFVYDQADYQKKLQKIKNLILEN